MNKKDIQLEKLFNFFNQNNVKDAKIHNYYSLNFFDSVKICLILLKSKN